MEKEEEEEENWRTTEPENQGTLELRTRKT